jgi:hypothetical protein
MSIHTITIRFISDNRCITRTEWGRRRQDAIKTLESIYGKGNFVVIEKEDNRR